MQILIAILVFGLLIFVHEMGHFLAAKATNTRVNGFSIGLGPRLFGKKIGETDFSLRLLPIGGACMMEGEDSDSDDPRAFIKKPVWARFLILVAGSVMNFVMGFVIILILVAPAARLYTTTIESFVPELSGSLAGMSPGDRIYKINGERVYLYADVSFLLNRYSGKPYEIEVIRDGERLRLPKAEIEAKVYEGSENKRYGINLGVRDASAGAKLETSWLQAVNYVRMIRMTIADIVGGAVGADQLTGPVGITATLSGAARDADYGYLWGLVAFIAINLSVVNLLPLPALDGGRILFLFVELVLRLFGRKRPDPKYEAYVHLAGLALFMLLMIYVTYNDIARLLAKA